MSVDFSKLPRLNLPPAEFNVRVTAAGRPQIFDLQRSRWVALTPEEWVRQHFVAMLISDKGYMRGRVANEVSLELNGVSRRCDTVVFDCCSRPLMVVEYKAPGVAITQKTFDQIARYNMILQARYLVVSNGLSHFCCEMDYAGGSYRFLRDIPSMDGEE